MHRTPLFPTLAAALLCLSTTPALAQSPLVKPEGSWVSITGEVAESRVEMFVLDYGQGLITVEMDDWDWYDEARRIRPGEKVTVNGRIDDSFYEARTIEASSVYAHERDTFFYASDIDEEGDFETTAARPTPISTRRAATSASAAT